MLLKFFLNDQTTFVKYFDTLLANYQVTTKEYVHNYFNELMKIETKVILPSLKFVGYFRFYK